VVLYLIHWASFKNYVSCMAYFHYSHIFWSAEFICLFQFFSSFTLFIILNFLCFRMQNMVDFVGSITWPLHFQQTAVYKNACLKIDFITLDFVVLFSILLLLLVIITRCKSVITRHLMETFKVFLIISKDLRWSFILGQLVLHVFHPWIRWKKS
jgi:hypothetical protein